jgi:tetratricopeptide (TPR) repeat protein
MDADSAALLERAAELRRSGRVEEAIAAYSELLEREPGLADSWYNLGWLQRQARQYEPALHSYAQALKHGVRGAEEVHVNRAVILSDHLARHEEAEAELKAALALNADYVPALLNLGNLHEDRGDRVAAQEAYERALAVAPDHPLALARLAGVVEPKSDSATTLIATLEAQIAATREPAPRADLGFALARLLDGRGEYDGAFMAAEAANLASRDGFGASFRPYDRAAQEAFVDRLISAFSQPAFGRGQTAPSLFICGMFRSGSTLIEQLLGGHSALITGGELDLIPALAARIAGYPEAAAGADQAQLESWRSFYLDGLGPYRRPNSLVTDKRPDNFVHIGLIKTLFPTAKIIHTRRNRLDNLISLHFLHLGPAMPYALDLEDSAHWFGEHERLMAHWKRLYPNDIFEVDYDTLVRQPKPILKGLLGFLELDWEDEILNFHQRSNTVKTASVWQVREPLHARSSGRWKHYRDQMERALGDLTERG